ncbi:PRC-barrel domain-containing protein [Noviherbaspirillum sp. ST9]|uniref:PRC-barrel domain-containing protein n=1 Tax=Noviherbaspirillum sp. ST9 TaxID=3401606 RepID=UPI003B587A0E
MLHSANALRGFAIAATDGELGSVRDVYFDDAEWVIRYLVVNTGGWPNGYDVLLSPMSVLAEEWDRRALRVNLTMQQIRNSPSIDTAKPVERQHEEEFNTYYGFPYYWAGPHRGSAVYPGVIEKKPLEPSDVLAIRKRLEEERAHSDPHLRSCSEVVGYHIHATDKQIGHVEDFLFDRVDWSIQLMAVDTRKWLLGKHVLVSPHQIERVSWEDRTVFVNVSKDQIEHSPEYDEAHPPESGAELELYRVTGEAAKTPSRPAG